MVMRMMIILQQLLLVSVAEASLFASVVDTLICRPDERDALLSFKTAFSIDKSSSSSSDYCADFPDILSRAKTKSWEKNGHCCKWDGVSCDFLTGHVVKLDLTCSQLSGSFPSNISLVRLPRLRYLSLKGNFLTGQVPSEIGWLSHLTTLDLSSNKQLTMPNFQTIISNLTDLRYLDLSKVRLASSLPPFIFNFSKLTYLAMLQCDLEGEFPIANGNIPMLARVTDIYLSDNMLTGTIPGWLFTWPLLDSLTLDNNSFTGLSEFDIGNASSLSCFVANNNLLQGKIPKGIFELHNLEDLDLEKNNLTETILLSDIHKLQLMHSLLLSDNNLSIIDDMEVTSSKPSWPSFYELALSSCNLGHFPNFLREHVNLTWLELSNNDIHHSVPGWFSTLGALEHLNLSHNWLQSGLEYLPWQSLGAVDIQYNFFHGDLPIPSPSTNYFGFSNNQFTGPIPHAFCNFSSYGILDLAQNNLTGSIPDCFASLVADELYALDLRQNQLQGAIPSSLFQKCHSLFSLSLSGNKFEGPIPQSIQSCSRLEFLDLSSNNLNDTFPHWLGSLPSLEVLMLGSNDLQGPIIVPKAANSFQMVQILDISNNGFTGSLPVNLLKSMKAMVNVNNTLSVKYIGDQAYQEPIMAWIKGNTRRLDEIYNKLVLIDVSRNKLEGLIPDAIGDLVSLRGLNLAHNNFTGHIPPSLSNLSVLESLDLSFNRLKGSIPTELVNLNSLAFFNVSENDLVGTVPTGKQFNTFLDSSYLGNPSLCGPLLTNKCGKAGDAPSISAVNEGNVDELSGLQVWDIGLMGCGSGMIAGLAWGYFIFWQNTPIWVERLILQIEALLIVHQRKRRQSKRRGTKRRRT